MIKIRVEKALMKTLRLNDANKEEAAAGFPPSRAAGLTYSEFVQVIFPSLALVDFIAAKSSLPDHKTLFVNFFFVSSFIFFLLISS